MGTLNVERILNIFNYFDGIIITDENGTVVYYTNFRTDLYNLRMPDIIGKSLLEIHPEMPAEESTIMRVLKEGKPIYDRIQTLTNEYGQVTTNICSTIPIIQGGKIAGAIDLSRCIDEGMERGNIVLPKIDLMQDNLYTLSDIITTSKRMLEIKQMIPQMANTDSTMLIYGETGTGKELIAQSIHTSSNRARKRFVSQNCAAIPSTLLESILFGTVKGSYTGAENRPGLFELANGGTLFLDEINSMEMPMQVKILKTIEEKQFVRLGGTETIHFDTKIVSAVNEDPYWCVQNNKLREDLFYRLNTVQLYVPPLRERPADINFLTEYFIAMYNTKMNKNVLGVTEQVHEFFGNYKWPGNVRELKNCIEGAFNIIGSRFIQMENLPEYMTKHYDCEQKALDIMDENMSLSEKVDTYERRLIVSALDSSRNMSIAADKLKISRQALNYKLAKYNLKSGE